MRQRTRTLHIDCLTATSLNDTARLDNHGLHRTIARIGLQSLDLLDDVHALENLAKHDVLPVEPGRLDGGDEELGALGVGAGVRHGEHARPGVGEVEVLVVEDAAVDALAAGAVAVGEIAALQHEVRDDAVEGGARVAEALLAGRQLLEVFRRLRHDTVGERGGRGARQIPGGRHRGRRSRQREGEGKREGGR